MSLSNGSLQIGMSAAEQVPNPAGQSDTHGASFSAYCTLVDGTGVGANSLTGFAQKVGDKTYATSTSITNIDLTAMAGGLGGANINFTKVKWFLVQNKDAVNSVTVSFNGTNGWTNKFATSFVLGPGEFILLPMTQNGSVVDATHKVIGLTALAGTPSVQVTVIGEGT
jgi:hypothetical protein